jgi:hypothetical protein
MLVCVSLDPELEHAQVTEEIPEAPYIVFDPIDGTSAVLHWLIEIGCRYPDLVFEEVMDILKEKDFSNADVSPLS